MRAISRHELPELIGTEIGVSDWLEITQKRVNDFATATADQQWIHVDVERANREIGGPIAHGFLTLSLIPFLSTGLLPVAGTTRGVNYGSDKVRFVSPVPVGKRIRLRQKLLNVEGRGTNSILLRKECIVEIEGEAKPACIAETLLVLFFEA